MAEGTAPFQVAPGAVRMHPDQIFWWDDDPFWRRGPDTPDGWWMIYSLGGPRAVRAVRIIVDDHAPERTEHEFLATLSEARDPDRRRRERDADDNEDAYLAALTFAAEIPPEELVRLRDAVRAGKAGGAADGRRPRNARTVR